VVRDIYLRPLERARGPRDTRSKRRLADCGDAVHQGRHRITSRRVDAVVSQPRSTPPCPQLDVADHSEQKTASTIPRYQRPSGVLRQGVRGTRLLRCNDPESWYAAADTPRPGVGE